jgi:large subunit ribosomal protein L25
MTLSAEPRTQVGKSSRTLLADKKMPAVVYGPKQEAISLTVPFLEFQAILRHGGEGSVIDLTGLDKPMQVLIHEIDRDPVTNQPRHADFYAIQKGAKVTVAVALEFVGESAAVKNGASLVKVLHEIEIEVAPEKLPHSIEVDLSTLENIGDQIHVSDLKIPAGVEVLTDGEEAVALIQEVVEEVEEETAAPDMSAIEVEQKGKGEEEESESE